MNGDFWILKTDSQKADAAAHLATVAVSHDKPCSVKIELYTETRRAAQNRLSHMWYSEASKQGKDYTAGQVKCFAKLNYGVPILLAEDADFAKYWEKLITIFPTYEEQCELMERWPVTSIMTVKQMSRYLSDFQRVIGGKYQLTDPALLGLEI